METARADAMKEFKASQPFIDSCAVYNGNEFENCLKQVKSIYPHLDLSKVTMDDPCRQLLLATLSSRKPTTPQNRNLFQKMIVSPADPPVTPLVPSTKPLNTKNPLAQDIQDKDDENAPDAPAS